MSTLSQDTEEFLFSPGLSSVSSDAESSITLRDQRAEILTIKSAMAEPNDGLT